MAEEGRPSCADEPQCPPDDAARAAIAQLEADGVHVTDARGDVTSLVDVERVVQRIIAHGTPLAGVVHAAVVYADSIIVEMDEERFKQAFYPKMLGAWNLHCATLGHPVEHFICFSSLSSIYGSTMQANYNAGNIFLDALAHYRRAAGLPAMTINWGSLGGAGYVARHAETAQFLESTGLRLFSTAASRRVLQQLTVRDAAQIGAGLVDWEQFTVITPGIPGLPMYRHVMQRAAREGGSVALEEILNAPPEERATQVEQLLAQLVANVFGIDVARIRYDDSLAQGGLDSLMAIELLNSINQQFQLSLSIGDLLSGSSIREVAGIILRNRPVAQVAEPGEETSTGSAAGTDERTARPWQGDATQNGSQAGAGQRAVAAATSAPVPQVPLPQPPSPPRPQPLPTPPAPELPLLTATGAGVNRQGRNGQNGASAPGDNGRDTDQWRQSPLVPIRRTGSRPPFFCVHPWAGLVYPYFELAGLLGPDQPVYGLQAVGLYQQPHTTIEQMASHYVEALRRVQPNSPYRLSGWSIGGLIAFEMAQQLRRAGEEVTLLAVFDEPAPVYSRSTSRLAFTKFMVTQASRHIWPDVQAYLRLQNSLQPQAQTMVVATGEEPITPRVHSENGATGGVQQRLQMSKSIVRELSALRSPQSMSRRMLATLQATMQAQSQYKAQPYDGHVTLLPWPSRPCPMMTPRHWAGSSWSGAASLCITCPAIT
ncbi:MAG: KR domain-containing protein [Caldilineaceae bacterium]